MLLFFDATKQGPAVDNSVCRQNACVYVTQVFVGKTWPQFLTGETAGCFFFSPCLLPHYVLFSPQTSLTLLFFFLLFHRTNLFWLQCVSLHCTAVFIIPAFACIPFRDSLLCLERQKKAVRSKTPPTSNPDGTHSFLEEQRDATKFRDIHLQKIET